MATTVLVVPIPTVMFPISSSKTQVDKKLINRTQARFIIGLHTREDASFENLQFKVERLMKEFWYFR